MKVPHLIRRLLAASTVAVALTIALPGTAAADFHINGAVLREAPAPPLENAYVRLYEETAQGPLERAWDKTDATGSYALNVAADIGTGAYTVRIVRPGFTTTTRAYAAGWYAWNPVMDPDPQPTERLADSDRYSTAVQVARERFTSPSDPTRWWGVDTVVIASGEDRAAADPLASAGLCAAYGETPLLLVSRTSVPSSVKRAIAEINGTYHTTRVIVVGGPASVPDARLAEIVAAAPHDVIVDRIITTGDRFDLAAAIYRRIAEVRGIPNYVVLVANGADPDKFFDALALSTVAASKAYPILLVNEDSIPAATRNVLGQGSSVAVATIGGGPATVSDNVMAQLEERYGVTWVSRWSGADRYRTTQAIADKAIANGLLDADLVGVAAKLPDALTGGATIGQSKGALLITNGESLTYSTGNWLGTHRASIDKCYVIGGTKSVTPGVQSAITSRLQ